MRDLSLYLIDILDAIKSIQLFVKGMDYESFKDDDKTVSAVIRKFEIIGEAVKQIPENIRKKYTSVPWRDISGMRDRLIHFYFGADTQLVWTTINDNLPELRRVVAKILRDLRKNRR
jgi:uncharacterized protein with HEPN domain